MYIENLLNNNETPPGTVSLILPNANADGGTHTIKGLIEQDVAFDMGVSWGSIIPNMESLTQFSQIVNNQNVFTWVSSSSAAWKGTDPFNFKITFWLVTYKYGQYPIKQQALALAKLCALYCDGENFATAKVHGGYTLNLGDSNKSFRNIGFDKDFNPNSKILSKLVKQNQGLITMKLGGSLTIDKLLVEKVTLTPSSVQVDKDTPLYIKVDATFRTNRALLVSDLENMFQ